MKINTWGLASDYRTIVREKRDGQSSQRHNHQNQNSSQQQKEENSKNSSQLTYEQVDKALQEFQGDTLTQSNGLSVSRQGEGLGLKVVLKDTQGNVIRQFSGEEFVRLRQATSVNQQAVGKILDQKL
jgi:uncharacterized FlaG/YvyC family protein